MKLSKEDKERLLAWKEGERWPLNLGNYPMLPVVAGQIVGRLADETKPRTARGRLMRIIRAARLVLDFLEHQERT